MDLSGIKTVGSWVALCSRISEVTEILNAPGNAQDRIIDNMLDVDAKIVTSYALVPTEVSSQYCQLSELDESAYGLNIQFLGIRVVLHRALVRLQCERNRQLSNPGLTRVNKSRAIMHDNAVGICRLLMAYREIFGLENIITIMLDNMYIAAGTLVSHVVHPPTGSASLAVSEELQFLKVLSEIMEAVQKHYPVAEKMRSTLSKITSNTELSGMFGSPAEPGNVLSPNTLTDALLSSGSIGAWGSIESLLTNDSILGGADMAMENSSSLAGFGSSSWMSHADLGLLP